MPPEITVIGRNGSFAIVDANENTVPGDAGDQLVFRNKQGTTEAVQHATPASLAQRLKAAGISSQEWQSVRFPALQEYLKLFKSAERVGVNEAKLGAGLLEGVRIFAEQTGIPFDENRAARIREKLHLLDEQESEFYIKWKKDAELDRVRERFHLLLREQDKEALVCQLPWSFLRGRHAKK